MGHSCPPELYMTKRERWDYHLLVTVFSPAFAASVIRLSFLPWPAVSHPRYQSQHVPYSQFAVAGMYHV